jgi:hypothetical protein
MKLADLKKLLLEMSERNTIETPENCMLAGKSFDEAASSIPGMPNIFRMIGATLIFTGEFINKVNSIDIQDNSEARRWIVDFVKQWGIVAGNDEAERNPEMGVNLSLFRMEPKTMVTEHIQGYLKSDLKAAYTALTKYRKDQI